MPDLGTPVQPRSPDWTRLAGQLPPVYQEDEASFAQVDAYLGLVDELGRAVVERLEELFTTYGPDAVLRWPTDVALDAGPDALLSSYLATYDEVAGWASFAFPPSWPGDEAGLAQRREFLARSARLWRRRGTPRGFLSWFSLYFGLPVAEQPYLLEHYKAPGSGLTDEPYTATLFIPGTTTFAGWSLRAQAAEFVARYAPAHVLMRTCFVTPEIFTTLLSLDDPSVLPEDPTPQQLADHVAALATQQADLNALLCSVVSVVGHAGAVHVYECIDVGRNVDRLDIGQLPTNPPA